MNLMDKVTELGVMPEDMEHEDFELLDDPSFKFEFAGMGKFAVYASESNDNLARYGGDDSGMTSIFRCRRDDGATIEFPITLPQRLERGNFLNQNLVKKIYHKEIWPIVSAYARMRRPANVQQHQRFVNPVLDPNAPARRAPIAATPRVERRSPTRGGGGGGRTTPSKFTVSAARNGMVQLNISKEDFEYLEQRLHEIGVIDDDFDINDIYEPSRDDVEADLPDVYMAAGVVNFRLTEEQHKRLKIDLFELEHKEANNEVDRTGRGQRVEPTVVELSQAVRRGLEPYLAPLNLHDERFENPNPNEYKITFLPDEYRQIQSKLEEIKRTLVVKEVSIAVLNEWAAQGLLATLSPERIEPPVDGKVKVTFLRSEYLHLHDDLSQIQKDVEAEESRIAKENEPETLHFDAEIFEHFVRHIHSVNPDLLVDAKAENVVNKNGEIKIGLTVTKWRAKEIKILVSAEMKKLAEEKAVAEAAAIKQQKIDAEVKERKKIIVEGLAPWTIDDVEKGRI